MTRSLIGTQKISGESNALNPRLVTKARVAIYARYSCDKQRETSLEDQIRRCKEIALRNDWQVDEVLIYTDAAISGSKEEAQSKRDSYQRFVKDWETGKFDVFIVDEFSRMSREVVEQAIIIRRLEKNRRVRMITAGGIDTNESDWQLRLGIEGAMAQQEIRKTQHRVGRGMVGQLERGYMIATPAFGYDLKREFDAQGNRIGTKWVVNDTEAAVVRQIFTKREAGQSMHQIAAWINSEGIPCTRKARKNDGGYWRPARVKTLLTNTIYKGIFVWHGSTTYRARAHAHGLDVETKIYLRPELHLVSDETWQRCNSKSVSRSGYGGGKHALGGLIGCGCCGGTLVLSSKRRCRSLYCANCSVAKSANAELERQTGSIAVDGIKLLLTQALKHFLTPGFLTAFRNSLRLRLNGDNQEELNACKARLAKLRSAQERLSHMLVEVTQEDPVLVQRYNETRKKVAAAEAQLVTLEASHVAVDIQAVEAQMQADPVKLLNGIFDADIAPERLRALLTRLFPIIVFEGKKSRYLSIFRIRFVPGAALAIASDTEAMMNESIECRFELKYWPINGRGGSQPFWTASAKISHIATDDDAAVFSLPQDATMGIGLEVEHPHSGTAAVSPQSGKRVMTKSKIEEAKNLLVSGLQVREVAKALGVSMPSIYRSIPAEFLPSVLFSPHTKVSVGIMTGCNTADY